MALTLAEFQKLEKQELRKGIIQNLLRECPMLEILPFVTASSMSVTATRVKELPSVDWRKINAGYTESTGHLEQVPETLKILGGDVDVDLKLQGWPNMLQDPVVTQTQLKMRAIGLEFKDTFINGSKLTDEDEFNGLKYRVGKLAARQTVDLAVSTAELHVFANDAAMDTFLDGMDKAWKRCANGDVQALFMNETTYLAIASLARRRNLLDRTKDMFGREINTWKGAPMYDIGLQADMATEIITDTEDPGDSGADTSSIYFVHFGEDEGVVGIQDAAPDMHLVAEELEAKPASCWRIDWACSLYNFGLYSIVRLKGFEMAAS